MYAATKRNDGGKIVNVGSVWNDGFNDSRCYSYVLAKQTTTMTKSTGASAGGKYRFTMCVRFVVVEHNAFYDSLYFPQSFRSDQNVDKLPIGRRGDASHRHGHHGGS